jgi:hypothetical protein
VRVCTDCAETKSLEAFTPIRGTPHYHGRCKMCRARRAWEQAHPGRRYADRNSGKTLVRTCTDCGEVKATAEFVRIMWNATPGDADKDDEDELLRSVLPASPFLITSIKACKAGCYGRCRACRAKRAKERYQTDPLERERQKARVRRNRQRRRSARVPLAPP